MILVSFFRLIGHYFGCNWTYTTDGYERQCSYCDRNQIRVYGEEKWVDKLEPKTWYGNFSND